MLNCVCFLSCFDCAARLNYMRLYVCCVSSKHKTGAGERYSDICVTNLDGDECAQPLRGITRFWGNSFESYEVRWRSARIEWYVVAWRGEAVEALSF